MVCAASVSLCAIRRLTGASCCALAWAALVGSAFAQEPSGPYPYSPAGVPGTAAGSPYLPGAAATGAMLPPASPAAPIVADVVLKGNQNVSLKEFRSHILTRAGRPLDPIVVQKDVRSLVATHKFFDVKVRTQPGPTSDTVVVVFEVFEYPKIEHITYMGNESIKERLLTREAALKVGDPMSLSAIDEARQKIQNFYTSRGFNQVRVEVAEGLNSGDRGARFVIHEGPQQRIWSVNFVGNTIVSGERLKTKIESKPNLVKYIKGYVDSRKIDEDIDRLTAYYRSLGYFRARIGRELQYDESGKWLYLTFVIDEGPRFTIRSVSFSGNRLFASDQLETLVELKPGEFFDQEKMTSSMNSLTEAYGGVGYIMADIQASPRTLESEPQLDLVYEVSEGRRYRIGRINVIITGDNPHTRQQVALNRLSFRSGDIADIREIRASERRLKASNLFANDPARGLRPQIVLHRGKDDEKATAGNKPPNVRGQSPDPPHTVYFDGAPVSIELVPVEEPHSLYLPQPSPPPPAWRQP